LQGISIIKSSGTLWTARFLTRNFDHKILGYTVNGMVSYNEFQQHNIRVHCEQHGFLQGISTTQYSGTLWTARFLTRNFDHKIFGYTVNSTVSYKEFQQHNIRVHCEQHGFLQGISITKSSGTLWTARFLTRNSDQEILGYTMNGMVSYKEFRSQNLRVHCEQHGFLQGIPIRKSSGHSGTVSYKEFPSQNLRVHCEQHGFLQGISKKHNIRVQCEQHGFLQGIAITKSSGMLWTAWFLARNFDHKIFGYSVNSTVS